ncbi:hypothetical protein [Nakamurella sp. PAMC28650]|uniref:hypothetical protein n=1 Tax=Nakamurella sp. PAMC28650 TaxID=2762325 RepID=UPI00164EBD4E|nr:hypothetical protein [Nakamurella sp. PAMC28650]QNK80422.1 hypothetical protein H7F38_19910 [Nakamurella sp. PAMC28650]
MGKLSKRGRIIVGVFIALAAIGGIQQAIQGTPNPALTASTPTAAATATSPATSVSRPPTTTALVLTTAQSATVTTKAARVVPAKVTPTSAATTTADVSINPEFAAATARCNGIAGPEVVEWELWPGKPAEGYIESDVLYPNPSDPSGPCLSGVDVFFSNSANLAPGTCLEVAYVSDNPNYDVNYTTFAAKPRKPFRRAGDSCG